MRLRLCVLLLIAATPVAAQDKRQSPLPSHLPLASEACFGRVYDTAHLQRHPRQQVTALHLAREFKPDPHMEESPVSEAEMKRNDGEYGRVLVTAYVRFRDRKGVYANSLDCGRTDAGKVVCGVDCDGGSFNLRAAGKALMLENNGFVVVGGCGASDDERENEAYVTTQTDDNPFRLDPKPFAACTGERNAMAPLWARLGAPLRERLSANETLCLSRDYDAAHLKSHPHQTVKRIAVLRTKDSRKHPDDEVYHLTFRIETRDNRIFEQETTCAPERYAFACTIRKEMDTQRDFYLTRAAHDGAMLRDRHGALAALFNTTLGADDRMFRLNAAPAATCRF